MCVCVLISCAGMIINMLKSDTNVSKISPSFADPITQHKPHVYCQVYCSSFFTSTFKVIYVINTIVTSLVYMQKWRKYIRLVTLFRQRYRSTSSISPKKISYLFIFMHDYLQLFWYIFDAIQLNLNCPPHLAWHTCYQ